MFATGNCSLEQSWNSRLLEEKNPDNTSIAKNINSAAAAAEKRSKLDGLIHIKSAVVREATESQLTIQVCVPIMAAASFLQYTKKLT